MSGPIKTIDPEEAQEYRALRTVIGVVIVAVFAGILLGLAAGRAIWKEKPVAGSPGWFHDDNATGYLDKTGGIHYFVWATNTIWSDGTNHVEGYALTETSNSVTLRVLRTNGFELFLQIKGLPVRKLNL